MNGEFGGVRRGTATLEHEVEDLDQPIGPFSDGRGFEQTLLLQRRNVERITNEVEKRRVVERSIGQRSRGITASLRAVGYGTDAQPWPIVTGQDAETASVKLIISGEQYSTVFKDTRELAKATVELVDKVLSGGKPEGLDTKTYNNDVKVVPSILLTPHDVDKSNYQALVVDSGYIKAEELK